MASSHKQFTSAGCVSVPRDVFTKTFRPSSGAALSVIYRTQAQTVAVLEADSAEVWTRIIESGGRLDSALNFILQNGQFASDPINESREALDCFLASLGEFIIGNLTGTVTAEPTAQKPHDSGRNAERSINLWMADHHILYSLVLELTYRCNENCVHCYCPSQRKRPEMPIELIRNLVEEFEELGGFSLQLTGGELLVRNDTKALLRHLCGRGLLLSIISNLTLLDEETLDLLKELRPRSVGCSIYSAEAALHDSVTTIPGSFGLSIQNIRRLSASGIPVVLKTPLMKHTVSGWKDIENLAGDLGSSCQFDLNITAKNDGGHQPLDLRVRDEEMIKELFATRFNRLHIHGEPFDQGEDTDGLEHAPLCGAGATGLAISPDGIIHPCIGLPIQLGQYPTNSLTSVWKTSPFFDSWGQRRLFDIPKCRECATASDCFRCPGAWFVESGDFSQPSDYTCFLAQLSSEASGRDHALTIVNGERR